MRDFWKGVIAVITFQWLFGSAADRGSGCGCGGCLTFLILGLCLILSVLGLI